MNNNSNTQKAARGWRGVEQVSKDDALVAFDQKRKTPQTDMTSMVDVTFLLLIFFMVTASFSLQKAMALPPTNEDRPSTYTSTTTEYSKLIIRIDQFNTFSLEFEGSVNEAPSEQELRRSLRSVCESKSLKAITIRVHPEAWHQKLVAAWDAAVDSGIENISIQTDE